MIFVHYLAEDSAVCKGRCEIGDLTPVFLGYSLSPSLEPCDIHASAMRYFGFG